MICFIRRISACAVIPLLFAPLPLINGLHSVIEKFRRSNIYAIISLAKLRSAIGHNSNLLISIFRCVRHFVCRMKNCSFYNWIESDHENDWKEIKHKWSGADISPFYSFLLRLARSSTNHEKKKNESRIAEEQRIGTIDNKMNVLCDCDSPTSTHTSDAMHGLSVSPFPVISIESLHSYTLHWQSRFSCLSFWIEMWRAFAAASKIGVSD